MFVPFPLGSNAGGRVIIGSGNWECISVPEPASLLVLSLFGPGGNGGDGFSGAAAASRGGGASGASGAVSQIILPINALTFRTFYLYLPALGQNGTAYMSLRPDSAQAYLVMLANGGGNGANGAGSGSATAGTAGVIATVLDGPYQRLGVARFRAGQGGPSGASINTNGGSEMWSGQGLIITAGAGGGGVTGTDRTGGGITGAGPVPTIPSTAAGSVNGQDGYHALLGSLPYSLGGQGGGASNASVGGNGGNGAPGSGGGGGGGGTTGGTGGRGGAAFAMLSWS